MRKTRRSGNGPQEQPPPTNLNNLLEHLHTDVEVTTSIASAQSVLTEASKQDVDKLLNRAGLRGSTAKKRKEAANEATGKGLKKGRSRKASEGEDSLFYQRRLNGNSHEGRTDSWVAPSSRSVGNDSIAFDNLTVDTSAVEENGNFDREGRDLDCQAEASKGKERDTLFHGTLEEDGFDWEDRFYTCDQATGNRDDVAGRWTGEVAIEVEQDDGGSTGKQSRKRPVVRRANAKDKEFAELVHKAHLLSLLARGRLVDTACNDPLLQASLLSLLPSHITFSGMDSLTAASLEPVVKWFQGNFRILAAGESGSWTAAVDNKESFSSLLKQALCRQAGTAEEVAALYVALLRSLGLITRYVSVLDVASLKPDAESLEVSANWDLETDGGVDLFCQITQSRMAASLGHALAQSVPRFLSSNGSQTSSMPKASSRSSVNAGSIEAGSTVGRSRGKAKKQESDMLTSGMSLNVSEGVKTPEKGKARKQRSSRGKTKEGIQSVCDAEEIKLSRKGDKEFELELARAMLVTAPKVEKTSKVERSDQEHTNSSDPKGILCKTPRKVPSSSKKLWDGEGERSGAMWSRKMGPLLHWAEVYCSGEGDEGRWVHVDAGRGLVDCPDTVERAASSGKLPLRYVVAFSGNGAKDVTGRYVSLWSSIGPHRVESQWWRRVLDPLKELEEAELSGLVNAHTLKKSLHSLPNISKEEASNRIEEGNKGGCSQTCEALPLPRVHPSCVEDMELDVRAYTEPLPSNQQAYKNHHLYVLEKWLTKYQVLHPAGPVLGYCGGQPVYPRTCVQDLHTAQRWLREGFKVRDGEAPAKVVRNARATGRQAVGDDVLKEDYGSEAPPLTTVLFGKWQTDPWEPPPAVDGIVPKNERGNVDVWSEKCLPQGTVHLALPHILPIAKQLGIDFAPAMVGFEIRNRKSVPVFDGIVVCQEMKDLLLEAYAAEEERRVAGLKKKKEEEAIVRWQQLLRSIATRQRLRDTYENAGDSPSKQGNLDICSKPESSTANVAMKETKQPRDAKEKGTPLVDVIQHEHTFPLQNQTYDEESGIRTKTCACGFAIEIEEL